MHAAGLAGVCLIVFVAWSVQTAFHGQVSANQTHEELTRMFLESAPAIVERHRLARERHTFLKDENDALLAKIPDLPQEAEFLGQLTQLSDQCGLALSDFRPGPHATRENYTEFDVQLTGRGRYESICRFLDSIDHLPRLCKLNDLRLAGADESGEECQVELRLIVPFALRLSKSASLEGQR